jgi:hypothetical protein
MQRADPSAWSATRYAGKYCSPFTTDSEEEKSGKVNTKYTMRRIQGAFIQHLRNDFILQ